MENESNTHVLSRLNKLEKEGYTDQLMFENSKLINLRSKEKYSSDQVKECREFRFEGMTNPSDMSLLFALTFNDGSKGTLTAAFGPSADVNLYDFMNKIDKSKVIKDKNLSDN